MEQGKPGYQMEAVGTPYPLITQALVRSPLGRAREAYDTVRAKVLLYGETFA
jgi:hypothetical protein